MNELRNQSNDLDDSSSITSHLAGLRRGAAQDQQVIWNRYLERLVRYAEYRLRRLGVVAEDGDDIAQQVFAGFFRRAHAGRFPQLRDRNDLWRILVCITNDRVIDARRKKHALTESALGGLDDKLDNTSPIERIIQDEPTPESGEELADNLRRLMERLNQEHPVLAQIAVRRLKGDSVQEISGKLNISQRTIERHLNRIRKLWTRFRQP